MEQLSLKKLIFAACSLACALSVTPIKACDEKTPPRGQASRQQGISRRLFTDSSESPEFPARTMTLEAAMQRIAIAERSAAQEKTNLQAAQLQIAQLKKNGAFMNARLREAEERVAIARNQAAFAEQRATQAEQEKYLTKKEATKASVKTQELEVDKIVAIHCSSLTEENRALEARARQDAKELQAQRKEIERLKSQRRMDRQKNLAVDTLLYESGLTQEPPR